MRTKICALCKIEASVMYRIQITKGKIWIFVCKECCIKSQSLENYKYGGTWKGQIYNQNLKTIQNRKYEQTN